MGGVCVRLEISKEDSNPSVRPRYQAIRTPSRHLHRVQAATLSVSNELHLFRDFATLLSGGIWRSNPAPEPPYLTSRRYADIAIPTAASNEATATPVVDDRPVTSRPASRSRIVLRCCNAEIPFTTTPTRTKAVPVQRENPDDLTGLTTATDPSSRRNSPKRATTNPNP